MKRDLVKYVASALVIVCSGAHAQPAPDPVPGPVDPETGNPIYPYSVDQMYMAQASVFNTCFGWFNKSEGDALWLSGPVSVDGYATGVNARNEPFVLDAPFVVPLQDDQLPPDLTISFWVGNIQTSLGSEVAAGYLFESATARRLVILAEPARDYEEEQAFIASLRENRPLRQDVQCVYAGTPYYTQCQEYNLNDYNACMERNENELITHGIGGTVAVAVTCGACLLAPPTQLISCPACLTSLGYWGWTATEGVNNLFDIDTEYNRVQNACCTAAGASPPPPMPTFTCPVD